jgi:hypothetical protein
MIMKKNLLTMALLCTTFSFAQYYTLPVANGNPNNVNQEDFEYPPGGGLPSGWTTIMTGGKTNPTWSSNETIPFTFQFNGANVTSYKVSSSGVLTFNTGTALSAPSHANVSLPSNLIPSQSICVWGLSGKGSNDAIVTKTFGTAPNRQHWVSFNNYSEPATFVNHYSYFSIVLEENSDRIYVVDQRNFGATPSLTVGVQVSASEVYEISPSPNYAPLAANSATRTDNKHYTFVPGSQLTEDVFVKSIDIKENVFLSSAPFSIDATIENMGSTTINEVVFGISVNGGAATQVSINGLSVAQFNTTSINLANSWSPTVKGAYTIKTWVETINQNPDLNNSNDTLVKIVNAYGNENKRVSLIETFTSSTSPTSMSSNAHVENFLNNNVGDLTSLKYQMNSPGSGDPYFTSEGMARKQFYAVSNINSIVLDGQMEMFSQQLNQDSIDKRLEEVAFVTLSADYWVNGKIVYITVDIDPLETFNGQNYVLHTAVYEKTTTQNAKSSGETTFHNVMKKLVPDENGVLIGGLNKSATVNQSLTYIFKGNYRLPSNANNQINHATEHSVENFNDLGVVVWIQNHDNDEVIQSAYAGYTVGLPEAEKVKSFVVYPNPAKEQVTIHFTKTSNGANVLLLDASGQLVNSGVVETNDEHTIDIHNLDAGIYYIKVINAGNVSIEKLIIQ